MKPYIANYVEEKNISCQAGIRYDEEKQMSFKGGRKVVECFFNDSTHETFTIENSDDDSFSRELLDDKSVFRDTCLTETLEPSDSDEFCVLTSTKHTATIEDSDTDDMDAFGGTTITKRIEQDDNDDFSGSYS